MLALLCVATPADAKKYAPGPDATQVVVRGRTLAEALEIACQPAWENPKKLRSVVLIFDATPALKAAATRIGDAFKELAKRDCKAKDWRTARLGAKVGKSSRRVSELPKRLRFVLSKPPQESSTFGMLRSTLKSVRKGAVVVYLADAHFEDDAGLEGVVAELSRKKATLSVIGGEAAFGHAWDDGIKRDEHQFSKNRTRGNHPYYFNDIGRNPFASSDPLPWHGGETAFPALPYEWGWRGWETRFSDYNFSTDLDRDSTLR